MGCSPHMDGDEAPGLFLAFGQHRQQLGRQDGNERDEDEQLDQRERRPSGQSARTRRGEVLGPGTPG
jgi:hypothetical protein